MKKYLREILIGVGVFVVGIILGVQINYGKLAKIEGFLFNRSYAFSTDSNATSSNATSTNATSSNATSANATSSNATSANATSSNATGSNATSSNATSSNVNYNDLYLSEAHVFGCGDVSLEKNDSAGAAKGCYGIYKLGDRLSIGISTTGDSKFLKALVYFAGNNSDSFTLEYPNNLIIPSNLSDDQYDITGILLYGQNPDGSTFTKYYNDASLFNKEGDYGFKIKRDKVTKNTLILNKFSITTTDVSTNDKVYVEYYASEKLTSMKVELSSDLSSFTVNVKSLDNKPYFEVPSNVEAGTYKVASVVIKSENQSRTYSNNRSSNNYYNFKDQLTIKKSENNKEYVYNIEDINNAVISEIYKSSKNSNIVINADNNTLVNADLFNAIKGTNKNLIFNINNNQIIFNGKNIKTSKTLDLGMNIDLVSNDQSINQSLNNGMVLTFAPNGSLPGAALVRINSDNVKNLNNNIFVYYYDESSNKYTEIASNVAKTADGYYEFNIIHNSKYVMVNSKLPDELIDTKKTNVVTFQRGNKTNYLLIGLGVLVAILVVVLIVFIGKNKKENEE